MKNISSNLLKSQRRLQLLYHQINAVKVIFIRKWFVKRFLNDDEGCDCRIWLALNWNDALVIKLKPTSCETNGYQTNMFHPTRLPKSIRLEKAKACQGRPSERANIWTEHQQWIIRLKLLVFRKVILNTINFALIAIK